MLVKTHKTEDEKNFGTQYRGRKVKKKKHVTLSVYIYSFEHLRNYVQLIIIRQNEERNAESSITVLSYTIIQRQQTKHRTLHVSINLGGGPVSKIVDLTKS